MSEDGNEDADEEAYLLRTKGKLSHAGPSPLQWRIGIDNCSHAKQLLFSSSLSLL